MQTTRKNTGVNYESGGSFHTVIGKTTYEVAIFFNKDSKVSLEEKLKRLIRQDRS